MRTDCPVWEQGYTFLVANPDNDGLYLKVITVIKDYYDSASTYNEELN